MGTDQTRTRRVLYQNIKDCLFRLFSFHSCSEADVSQRARRSKRPIPRMLKKRTPHTLQERAVAFRALPRVVGRVTAVDFTGFTFQEQSPHDRERPSFRVMRTGMNPKKEEELLASGELVTLFYTQTKQRRRCLLRFERMNEHIQRNIDRCNRRRN